MAFAAALAEKRGPRVGDAASLWNFTPAPGWTREEVQILRLCVMKHGVGQWLQILGTGLLPGKMIQQLNGQTQRLLGQQSLAAFTGLRVDVDRIRTDNEARTEATRKAGLIIYDGPNLTKEMKAEMREEAQRKYGLTPEQIQKVDEQMEEIAAAMRSAAALAGAGLDGGGGGGLGDDCGGCVSTADLELVVAKMDPELGDLIGQPLELLSPDQLIQLLKRLRNRLAVLSDLQQAPLSLPPRTGPRWEGEPAAAALLRALEETSAAAAAAAGAGASGAVAAGIGGTGAGGVVLEADGMCRVMLAGRGAAPPRPPSMGSLPVGAAAVAARKRNKSGGKPPRAASSGSGAAAHSDGYDGEWSGGEENAAPSRGGARGVGGVGGGGAKRKAGGAAGGVGGDGAAEGAGVRRATRAKRPATRYDKYVDDGEYDGMDPDGGIGGGGGLGGGMDHTEALHKLTAMGFTPRKARGALQDCNFNVEAAVEWLVANCK